MNSFFAWVGGKKLLRKEIIRRFPEEYGRYVEVFGGAGWVLFGKEEGKELEVFNDADGELINLYRCVKYHCGELQKELEWLLVSREQFFDNQNQLASRGFTDIQRAARYFHVIKVSFGADLRTFGTHSKNLAVERLEEIKNRLKKVVIENRDFESLIKTYDRPGTLFYLDPPYHGTEKYYAQKFSQEDHIRLCECLKRVKGKFILSYNDDEFIRDMYKDFHIYEIERHNNLSSKSESKVYKELIIQNY